MYYFQVNFLFMEVQSHSNVADPRLFHLKQMETALHKENVVEFIIQLEILIKDHLTCFCFLHEKGKEYWQEQQQIFLYIEEPEPENDSSDQYYSYMVTRAFFYLMLGEEKKAYENFLIANSGQDLCYFLQAYCDPEINPNRLNDALAAVALSSKPNASYFQFLAGRLYQEKKINEAISCYQKAISLNHYAPCVYRKLAICLGDNHEYSEAIKNFEIAILQNPNDSSAYFSKSYLLSQANRFAEAIQCSTQATHLFPAHYQHYFQLAYAQHKSKNLQAAIINYEKYLEKRPNDATALSNLKQAKSLLQKDQEAERLHLIKSEKKSIFYKNIFHLFYYIPQSNDRLSSHILAFKNGDAHVNKAFALCIANELKKALAKGLQIDYLIRALGSSEKVADANAPLDIFARSIATEIGAEYISLLTKQRPTRKFSRDLPTYQARINEINGVYNTSLIKTIQIRQNIKTKKNILILDDVATSGATREAIGKALKMKFPECTLHFLSIAQTNRDIVDNNDTTSKLVLSFLSKVTV